MRRLALLACFAAALALAQEPAERKHKPPPKRPVATPKAAHQRATPQEIRKFNELEKKQKEAK
jgi:hypothetical protein